MVAIVFLNSAVAFQYGSDTIKAIERKKTIKKTLPLYLLRKR